MFNFSRKGVEKQEFPKLQEATVSDRDIQSEAHYSAILKSRAEITKMKSSSFEKYYALAWGVFVDKDERSHFFDSSCLPYRLSFLDFEGSSLKVELLGDKIVWLSHSNVELPEVYIEFRSSVGEDNLPYALISRNGKSGGTNFADHALLADFALGVFGDDIAYWGISESHDNKSAQSFWADMQQRNPEITLMFQF